MKAELKTNSNHQLKWYAIRFILGIVLALSIIFIGIDIGDYLFIKVCYGSDAYAEGLRVIDSKHGILSTGEEIHGIQGVKRILLIYLLILPVMVANILFVFGINPFSKEGRLDRKWDKAAEKAQDDI